MSTAFNETGLIPGGQPGDRDSSSGQSASPTNAGYGQGGACPQSGPSNGPQNSGQGGGGSSSTSTSSNRAGGSGVAIIYYT